MFILGYQGMPRRYFDYPPQYFTGHLISTVGSWIVAAALLIIFGNLVRALYKGEKAPDNPWNGKTLEWLIPSPPPRENFKRLPILRDKGYFFDDKED
jgi:cytochrome c oxidase subunit I